jgi:hypothetical protein
MKPTAYGSDDEIIKLRTEIAKLKERMDKLEKKVDPSSTTTTKLKSPTPAKAVSRSR